MKRLTTEQFIEKAKQVHGNRYDYSLVVYNGLKNKVKIICKKHGVFEQQAGNHLMKKGCSDCKGGVKLTQDEFIKKSKQVHGSKYNYSYVVYVNYNSNIKIVCQEHGMFEQLPCNHLKGCGCPKCSTSKGELQIEQYLKENNFQFESQKKFSECKNKRTLPFDFYLAECNTIIEYDGEQHFISKPYFGGDESLKQIQYNDKIKTKFCKDNNIKLIRISYKENVEQKLKEFINENQN